MNKDKKRLYIISFSTFALLFAALFTDIGNSKWVATCILIPAAAITCFLIKRRRSLSINKKEVLLLTTVVGVIYIVLYQMTAIFFELYKNPYFVSLNTLLTTILPLATIIVSNEIIRYVILAQKDKITSVIVFLTCVLADVLAYSNLSGITSFNRFMDLVGLTLFPAISANVYYHYVSKRYGALPNIVFRLITTLYIYFIPNVTGMPDSLTACIKLILPIVMLAFVSSMFEKEKKNAVRKGKKLGVIGTVVTVAFVVSVAMLISCQFRFGALVIATESMTGEINKGDMILYERYDAQPIKEGQVIVFQENESKIVHRVVKIENIGGEIRYYTKGDANKDLDDGYRTESDIIGLTDVKLAYLGYPTLWIREIIQN